MKANINGTIIEGTPEEIFDLLCRMGDAGSVRNRKDSSADVNWKQFQAQTMSCEASQPMKIGAHT